MAATTGDPPFFAVTVDGPVATVWLDRPDKRNALDARAWSELPDLMERIGGDPAIRVAIMAGRGRAFCSGIDLDDMAFLVAPPEADASGVSTRRALLSAIRDLQRAITSIADCPKPVIAAVHGACLGGGVDLITACDIRLAAADATFSVRETRMAIVADLGTLQRLPRIVGPGRAAEMIYTGRDLDAGAAVAAGLVAAVYGDLDETLAAARRLAAEIAANSPLAVQGSKAVMRAAEATSEAEALEYTALWNAAFLHSSDLGEAMRARRERRTPDFGGE